LSNPGIIIQARLGSSRFPRKILHEIDGKRLLDIVYEQCTSTELPVVLAMPIGDKTDEIKINPIFFGAGNDVISRFYHCAKKFEFDPVIRVCADAKLIYSDLILQQLENYNNYKHLTYGNFCEVFSFKQLEDYYLHDKRPITREHVTMGMISDMTVDYEIDLI
jgi:spore coat polysaccharide biosynthesis protein SpsF